MAERHRSATCWSKKARLEPDPDTAPIVKEIFRLYVSGMGCGLVSDELRRRGHRVLKCRVLGILRNATYTGRNKWRGEYVDGRMSRWWTGRRSSRHKSA